MKQIIEGNSTPAEFIEFISSQKSIDDLKNLEWSEQPIWKVFLSTMPKDEEFHQFLVAYKELGGDLFELDRYKKSVLYFRLEGAKNRYELTPEAVFQTFELAGDLSKVENLGTAIWEYCIRNEWEESEKAATLTRYHELGGDCSIRGGYGNIFKEIAGLPSTRLWKLVASWIDVELDDEFVVGGEGAERIEFCEFLVENQVPLSHWGGITMDYALGRGELASIDKLIELGWEVDLDETVLYDRAKGIDTFRKLIDLGVTLNPKSTYPGDSPVYSAVYNLSFKLEDYRENPQDHYLEWANNSMELLKLLLQNGGRLDLPFEYTSDYPPLVSFLTEYPEIYDLIKAHGEEGTVAFLAKEMKG